MNVLTLACTALSSYQILITMSFIHISPYWVHLHHAMSSYQVLCMCTYTVLYQFFLIYRCRACIEFRVERWKSTDFLLTLLNAHRVITLNTWPRVVVFLYLRAWRQSSSSLARFTSWESTWNSLSYYKSSLGAALLV